MFEGSCFQEQILVQHANFQQQSKPMIDIKTEQFFFMVSSKFCIVSRIDTDEVYNNLLLI